MNAANNNEVAPARTAQRAIAGRRDSLNLAMQRFDSKRSLNDSVDLQSIDDENNQSFQSLNTTASTTRRAGRRRDFLVKKQMSMSNVTEGVVGRLPPKTKGPGNFRELGRMHMSMSNVRAQSCRNLMRTASDNGNENTSLDELNTSFRLEFEEEGNSLLLP